MANPTEATSAPVSGHEQGDLKPALGFFDALVIGLASVSPAYSLAAILGLLVVAAGVQAPAVILVSFVPMVVVATAYYYLNKAEPDCGTTFAWAARALGPVTGWMAGWAILTAGIIVIGLLANTAAVYLYLLFGADGAADSKAAVMALSVALMGGATYVTWRGIEISARLQNVLLALQLFALGLLAVVAIVKVLGDSGTAGSVDPSLSWFSPFAIDGGTTALIAGLLLAIFAFWGWDSSVAVNEETQPPDSAPGRAAVIAVFILLGIYLLVTVAAIMWLGAEELSAFEDEGALAAISEGVFGSPLDKLAILAVFTAALASTQTTVLPSSRTLLSMGRKLAVPRRFGDVHPVFRTPTHATWWVGGLAIAFYVLFRLASESFYENALLVLGLLICVNYGANALACIVFFRHRMRRSLRDTLLMGVLPGIGLAIFAYVFVRSLRDFTLGNVEGVTYWFGIQAPLVIFLGLLALGIVFITLLRGGPSKSFFGRSRETFETSTAPAPQQPV